MTNRTSRLAPSPTGALHLGNIRTFLVNWAMARQAGWTLLMRMEDLDGPRVKSGVAAQTLDLMRWIGLEWDGPTLTQSEDLEPYRDAMRRLTAAGVAYRCDRTRRDVELASSAPHAEDGEVVYPASLRPDDQARFRFEDESTNYRFVVPSDPVPIEDGFADDSTHAVDRQIGDFVIWTRRAAPAYQLAVVVDDARQGVDAVVRGDDLLPSAARQTLLYRALDLAPPAWWHLPLVIGPDGRRLAKRHGDTRLATYRDAGVRAERIVGLMAWWCGLTTERTEMNAGEFRDGLELATLPRDPVVCTEEDHAWLTG